MEESTKEDLLLCLARIFHIRKAYKSPETISNWLRLIDEEKGLGMKTEISPKDDSTLLSKTMFLKYNHIRRERRP